MQVREMKVEMEKYTRYFKVLTDIETTNPADKMRRKFEFLRDAVEVGMYNGLLSCGPRAFDKLHMEHNGSAWEIRLESEVYK